MFVVDNNDVTDVMNKWLSLNDVCKDLVECKVGDAKYEEDTVDVSIVKKEHYSSVEDLFIRFRLVNNAEDFYRLQLKLLVDKEPSSVLAFNSKVVREGASVKVGENQSVVYLLLNRTLLNSCDNTKFLGDMIDELKVFKP